MLAEWDGELVGCDTKKLELQGKDRPGDSGDERARARGTIARKLNKKRIPASQLRKWAVAPRGMKSRARLK